MRALFSVFILLFFACERQHSKVSFEPKKEVLLSFIVAGHAYGNPMTYTNSIYPKFYQLLKRNKSLYHPDFIILTGDVVAHPTPENWTTVKKEMDSLGVPWYIAPGNHDISHYLFEHIQSEPYLALSKANNLLLVLNTSHPGWSVDSLQLRFIDSTLNVNRKVENLFVFSHQLWWLKNRPEIMDLDSIRPNSFALFDGDLDFWNTGFEPIKDFNKPTYFFAGDAGCVAELKSFYYDTFKNFHFYGSGIGGDVEDNFLYISVFKDGNVQVAPLWF